MPLRVGLSAAIFLPYTLCHSSKKDLHFNPSCKVLPFKNCIKMKLKKFLFREIFLWKDNFVPFYRREKLNKILLFALFL